MTTRRRLSTDDRRAELLEAGKRLFAEAAFDHIRTGDLARLTGTSTGLLYHYFGHKRGYYVATMRHVADEVLAATTPPPDAPLLPAVAGALDRFLAYVTAHEAIYRALMRGGIGSDAEVQAIVESVRRALVDRVAERLPTPADAFATLRIYGWIGFVEFVVMDWLETRSVPAEALPPLLLDALLRILRPKES
ncbi:MAG: TetR family transcriptional regulator [Myxococcales bacterium]|nr:TetR family transcriptional regulator [Myxococcales bacterium]